jgi:PHD/YefM family antitoxin component YafN of YafNO toxin-antitoxin module
MSKTDFDSMMETMRIERNPYLRDKILQGMEQVRQGKAITHELIEDYDA